MATLVLTAIGDDRAGLVDALAGAVASHGGNWHKSHMARLAGKFAGIVLVTVPDPRADALVDALDALEAGGLLQITVEQTDEPTAPSPAPPLLNAPSTPAPSVPAAPPLAAGASPAPGVPSTFPPDQAATARPTLAAPPASSPPSQAAALQYRLELVGQDRPGIVHDVSQALATRDVNIEELTTAVTSAPMAGGSLFTASATLSVPGSVPIDDLRRDLEALADELMVDIDLTS